MIMSAGKSPEQEKSGNQEMQGFLDFIEGMTKSEDSSNQNNVFDSVDFNNFLQQRLMRSNDSVNDVFGSGDLFKSKEFLQQKLIRSNDSVNDIFASGDYLSLFKSKESFVSAFLSKDSETIPSRTKSLPVGGDKKHWRTTENLSTTINTKTTATDSNIPLSKDGKVLSQNQKSQDWIKFNTLGKHVEIPLSMGMFSSTVIGINKTEGSLSTSSTKAEISKPLTKMKEEKRIATPSTSSIASTMEDTRKKKRKRSPRKKVIPQNKKYLVPSKIDVLMGRGGKSNHHPGNMRYRAEIENLQEWYKTTEDKDEKTKISEKLVEIVHSYGGNFLEKDENGWYIIDDVVARRKVSQALREDKDPEKRRVKRQRFLAKRARLAEDARRKEISTEK